MAGRAMVAVLATALLSTLTAAATVPSLRSVASSDRHVAAVFVLGDLMPGEIAIAFGSTVERSGAFPSTNVRLREWMTPQLLANGLARWKTRHALRAGAYYVEISGIRSETDCKPGVRSCYEVWSAPRRVVVRP